MRGSLQQDPGDRDALLLAARELVAALADDRVVAVGELEDPVDGSPRPGVAASSSSSVASGRA